MLHVELAEYGERVSAFLLDVLFLIAIDVALFLLMFVIGGRTADARCCCSLYCSSPS